MDDINDIASSQFSPSALPGFLWDSYVEYLWYYQPDSWVARTASFARVLAVLVALPIAILGMLDIASYVIARTLGVIDDVKASTSDKSTVHSGMHTPSIMIQDTSTSNFDTTPADSDQGTPSNCNGNDGNAVKRSKMAGVSLDSLNVSEPSAFYAGEDAHLKLSGVGVFSPATSQPPSPTLSRRNVFSGGRGFTEDVSSSMSDDGLALRRRHDGNSRKEEE